MASPSTSPSASPSATDAEHYETQHVHDVYQQIASHFSSTRYKPWPLVHKFLASLPSGSVGIDAGCGNGKYLAAAIPGNTVVLASDRSENLVEIAAGHAQHAQHARFGNDGATSAKGAPGSVNVPQVLQTHPEPTEHMRVQETTTGKAFNAHGALVADSLALPHPSNCFDFAVSIAVVHHFSTRERRIAAIAELLRCLRPHPEQSYPARRERREREGGRALVFVWALEQKSSRRGWDQGDDQDVMVPWVTKNPRNSSDMEASKHESLTFERYYHLYRKGELEADVSRAGGVVLESGYEKDNWWAMAVKEGTA